MINNNGEDDEFKEQILAYQKYLHSNPGRVFCFNCGIVGDKEDFALVQVYNVLNEKTGAIDVENDYYFCECCFYYLRESASYGGTIFNQHHRCNRHPDQE